MQKQVMSMLLIKNNSSGWNFSFTNIYSSKFWWKNWVALFRLVALFSVLLLTSVFVPSNNAGIFSVWCKRWSYVRRMVITISIQAPQQILLTFSDPPCVSFSSSLQD